MAFTSINGFDIYTEDGLVIGHLCGNCSLNSIKVMKRSISYLKKMDGVKEILLTAAYSSLDEAWDEYEEGKNEFSKGFSTDLKKAERLLESAATRGLMQAQFLLAEFYEYGVIKEYMHSEENKRGTTGAYFRDTLRGYAPAQKKPEKAIEWYKKAAEQGHVPAQARLGEIYYKKKWMEQDYKEAAKWLEKAAEQGDALSQHYLAILYYKGYGVSRNYKKAIKLLRKVADKGDASAQFQLAFEYYQGKVIKQNYKESIKWFRKSADQGYFLAYNFLAWIYATAKDPRYLDAEQALDYAHKAMKKKRVIGRFMAH